MAQPIIHHRTPQFSALFAEAREGLRKLFQTQQDVLILAASGTGGMEAAVANCFAAEDKVIVINAGKFGDRWVKLCRSFEVEPIEIAVEWGKAVEVERVKEVLHNHPDVRGVFVQATETSTTVAHPVEQLAALTREHNVLLVVDGITAVGAYDIPMDRWGIDVMVTGSQKALMLPPGLAFIALSKQGWARVEKTRQRRFYFDLLRERESQSRMTTAYTPAISLITGLRESLAMIEEEGLQVRFGRHERLARATRAAARGLDLRLLAPENPSPAATGMYVPEGIDGSGLVGYLRDKMQVTFGGGQDRLKGRVVRIGHLGYIGTMETIAAVGALEMALRHFGHPVTLGKGVAAAEEVLMDSLPQ
jgi:aspartate aminotransferase-like enzyme